MVATHDAAAHRPTSDHSMSLLPDDERTVLATVAARALDADAHVQNALPIGTRLGEFEITGLLGEGGFGIVYLAYDSSLERSIALKEYMPSSLAARVALLPALRRALEQVLSA